MSSELIIIRPDQTAVAIHETALVAKETALEQAALIGVVKDATTQEAAILALGAVKKVASEVEKARKKTKEPVLDLGRAIDKAAADFAEELKAEEMRLNTLIGNFQQEQLAEARRQEVKRQEELRRIEDERRAEERRIWQQQQDAERARLEAEAKAKREAEEAARKAREAEEAAANAKGAKARKMAEELAAKAKAEADAAAKKQAEEAERLERERQAAAAKAAAEEQAATERAAQAQEMLGGQAMPIQAAGQSSKPSFDFEVVDVWKLARSDPGFVKVEPVRSAILAAINEYGRKEIAGVRIFEVVKTRVNTRGSRVIEV